MTIVTAIILFRRVACCAEATLYRKAYIIDHWSATDHCRKRAVFDVQWRVFGRRGLCPE
jgi:hypothetical protein